MADTEVFAEIDAIVKEDEWGRILINANRHVKRGDLCEDPHPKYDHCSLRGALCSNRRITQSIIP